ncbi:hypothetical protein LXT21_32210 [Myxococcus sp. K38C18041901]|nr:hypothetical protein [Myxococcus guangdongensis]MCP3063452.1 hypothetical protein [Myxococcus guangdongensis]
MSLEPEDLSGRLTRSRSVRVGGHLRGYSKNWLTEPSAVSPENASSTWFE